MQIWRWLSLGEEMSESSFDPLWILDLRGRSYMQTFEQCKLDNKMLVGMRIEPLEFDASGKILVSEGKFLTWTKNT